MNGAPISTRMTTVSSSLITPWPPSRTPSLKPAMLTVERALLKNRPKPMRGMSRNSSAALPNTTSETAPVPAKKRGPTMRREASRRWSGAVAAASRALAVDAAMEAPGRPPRSS